MKSVFKAPLCTSCHWFRQAAFEDGSRFRLCGYFDITMQYLAIECSKYEQKEHRLQKWMDEISDAESARKLIIIDPNNPQTGPGSGYV